MLFRSKARSKAGNSDRSASLRRVMVLSLVGDEVAAPSEEKLQLGDLFFAWLELTEVRPHPSLIGDDVGITGIGFGLSAVSVAGSVNAEAGDVENPLVSLPQQC